VFTPKSGGYLPQETGPLCQLYSLSIYTDQLSKAMSFIIVLQFFSIGYFPRWKSG